MESSKGWDLPDDPFERQQRVAEIADQICDDTDRVYFEYMNRVLERVIIGLGRAAIEETP